MSTRQTFKVISTKAQPQVGSVYREYGILQFTGLNNKYSPIHIADTESPDCMNVTFDELGAITKRTGYTQLNAAVIDSNPIQSLLSYYKSDGTKQLLATSGTSIYQWNGNGFAAIKTGLNGSGLRFTATTYYDKLYLLNGNTTDGLMQWDGTTFSNVSSAPNGQFVIVHKNHLYIAGDPNNPNRLYMSDLGEPTSWPSLNFIDINTNDGDKIMGMVEYMDGLAIFKENSLHILRGTDPNNYVLVDAHVNRGTISHWSIVNADNVLFFLARDGVYAFDGKHLKLVSDPISGSVLGINGQIGWCQDCIEQACAVDYKNKYWLSVSEGNKSENNRIYVFDYIHGIWTRYDLATSCLIVFDSSSGRILYSGDIQQGYVYQQDNGDSDNGNNINAYFYTKQFDFGSPGHFKSYKGLFFYAAQQFRDYSINITYIGDFGKFSKIIPMSLGSGNPTIWGSNLIWGSTPWGAASNVITQTTNIAGQSRYLQFKVSGNGSDQPFTFYGWILLFNTKRRLR